MEAEAAREREHARLHAQDGDVPCRIYECPYAATHGVGSKSPRWSNLCDEHYQEEIEKAQRSAGRVARERAEGQRPPLPPPANRNGTTTTSGEEGLNVLVEPERTEIAGARTKHAERLVRVAKQIDVIEAQITLLREAAGPLVEEWETLMEQARRMPGLGAGPLDLAQGVSDGEPHD